MNIYISNLGDKVTNESLRAVFATYGEVSSSRLTSHQLAGYREGALIEMPKKSEALAAIAGLNGSILDGRAISVAEAEPCKRRTLKLIIDRLIGPAW